MFKAKTVFVVGAGASSEVRMPLGADLTTEIANLCNISYRDQNRPSGSRPIINAINQFVQGKKGEDINDYFLAGRKISDAMPISPSIDDYINSQSHNEKIKLIGKLGIAQALIAKEKKCPLRIAVGNRHYYKDEPVTTSWYAALSKTMCANVAGLNADAACQNVSFIVFNYDRCIEQYLTVAFQQYLGVNFEKAHAMVNSICILHPYGKLGNLPGVTQDKGEIPFGGDDEDHNDLFAIASNIRTYHESQENSSLVDNIHRELSTAKNIVFLGFQFHEQNMRLLTLPHKSRAETVYATRYLMSDPNFEIAEKHIASTLGHPLYKLYNFKGQCRDLFSDYYSPLIS